MNAPAPHNLSPADLLDSLDPDAIAARLDELDRESRALRVLLRSARARRRGQGRPPAEAPEGGPCDAP
jgi:hypothetical protein